MLLSLSVLRVPPKSFSLNAISPLTNPANVAYPFPTIHISINKPLSSIYKKIPTCRKIYPLMESTSLSSDRFPEGLRILVVDADAACLKNLEKMLTKLKYQVRVSNQGREALDMIEKRKTGLDIVISDENVGDMDGFLFVEQVGRSKTNLPVIMTSSNGETTSVMKGVQYGACDYLVKPIRLKDLRYIWKHAFRIRISTVNVKQSIDISATTTTGVNSSGDDDNDGDGDNSERRNINESSPPVKKPRVVWTPFLHSKFEEAVSQIGVECAGPKKIQELMGIPWLSRENVASHLQKYRLFLQRQKREDEVKAAYAGNNASNMLGQSGNSLTLQQNIVINKNNYCPSNVNGEGNVNMYGDSTPHYMTNNQQLQLNEPSSMALAHYNRADFNPLFQYNHFPNTDDLYDNNRHYGIGTENIPPHHTLSPHYHQQQNMNLGSRPVLRLREVELPEFPSALEDIYLQDPHTVRRDSLDYINQEGPASHDQPHSAPRDQADANDPHVWRQ